MFVCSWSLISSLPIVAWVFFLFWCGSGAEFDHLCLAAFAQRPDLVAGVRTLDVAGSNTGADAAAGLGLLLPMLPLLHHVNLSCKHGWLCWTGHGVPDFWVACVY